VCQCYYTHIGHRAPAVSDWFLLAGQVGVPVADQAVVLHAVVLVTHQPVGVHLTFPLNGAGVS
jgi:hypothetical protein